MPKLQHLRTRPRGLHQHESRHRPESGRGAEAAGIGLLAGLKFNSGKSYADFNSSTDKVAEYGLAALIGGIAAKKLGLLALAGVFLAKFAKVIALGGLALAGGAFKFWKRKPKPAVIPSQIATGATFETPAKAPTDARDG